MSLEKWKAAVSSAKRVTVNCGVLGDITLESVPLRRGLELAEVMARQGDEGTPRDASMVELIAASVVDDTGRPLDNDEGRAFIRDLPLSIAGPLCREAARLNGLLEKN